jgi:hypothetical protein
MTLLEQKKLHQQRRFLRAWFEGKLTKRCLPKQPEYRPLTKDKK